MDIASMATFTRTHASSFSFMSTVTRRRHDVFLSFRGEDTRYNITANLHRALVDAGVPTFKDDVNLQKGGEIASELLKAVQMSRIAIVVFSDNYATSGWCLDELVKIVECNSEVGQVVLPIFYDVEPKNVREQMGSFEEALRVHEERGREKSKVEAWRKALVEAANQPHGWDMHNVASWHQSKFIKEIVKHVLSRYQDAHMSVSIFPPRLDVGKEYINLLLSVISDDILIIGICGMDKTAIARDVYNQNFDRFDSSTFLKDVSIIAEQPNGLLALQKQFLSNILADDNLEIDDVKKGTDLIKDAVSKKRVLVVLDNVNNLDQLNALARSREWFGLGSRIVITTRDEHLLNVLEIDDLYGAHGIEVIEEQFKQNLQMIEDLKEFIQKSHVEAYDRMRSLITEIEAVQRENNAQAHIMADLQQNLNQSFPLNALDSTTDVVLYGKGPENCEGYSGYEALLDFVPENEMIIGDAAGSGGELRGKMHALHVGSKDLVDTVSPVSSESCTNALTVQGSEHGG